MDVAIHYESHRHEYDGWYMDIMHVMDIMDVTDIVWHL